MRGGKRASVLLSLGLLAGMGVLTSYSATLYRLFCQVTGYGGTTQVADAAPTEVLDRKITVRFNADTDPKLPWRFVPVQNTMEVRVGEPALALYRATSNAEVPVTGNAVFNVTPDKTGIYFDKIDCFCFKEQTLAPGQTVDMPVQFFIDPAIVKDRGMNDITTITLSYTFFRSVADSGEKPVRSAAIAGPAGPTGP